MESLEDLNNHFNEGYVRKMSEEEVEILKQRLCAKDDVIARAISDKNNWIKITVLLMTILGGTCGYIIRGTAIDKQVAVNTVRLDKVEGRLDTFDKKLDLVLLRLPQAKLQQ